MAMIRKTPIRLMSASVCAESRNCYAYEAKCRPCRREAILYLRTVFRLCRVPKTNGPSRATRHPGAGAEAETVYLRDKEINYCHGCFTCWSTTPGTCIHEDDMPPLLGAVRQADVVVYATQSGEPTRVVLISNCGYPERHHFTALEETFCRFTASPGRELVGVITCAAGELLNRDPLPRRFRWYIDAVQQAGREIVELDRIREETQELLDSPLINPAVYSRMVNGAWDKMMALRPDDRQTDAPPQTGD